MEYRKRLNPEHSLRTPNRIKGTRQKVIVTYNPSEIDQAQELLVRFPNLGSDDVIIPGMANLSFNIQSGAYVSAIYIRIKMFMKELHTALFVAPTGVGKTQLALNLLENEYRNHFDFIVIICPTLRYNSTYKN